MQRRHIRHITSPTHHAIPSHTSSFCPPFPFKPRPHPSSNKTLSRPAPSARYCWMLPPASPRKHNEATIWLLINTCSHRTHQLLGPETPPTYPRTAVRTSSETTSTNTQTSMFPLAALSTSEHKITSPPTPTPTQGWMQCFPAG